MDKNMKYLFNNQDKIKKYFENNDCLVLRIGEKDSRLIVQVLQNASHFSKKERAEILIKTQNYSNPYGSLVRYCELTSDKIFYDYGGEICYKGFENAVNNYQSFLCKVCPEYKDYLVDKTLDKLSDIIDVADEMKL